MRNTLIVIFLGILAVMLAGTVAASLDRPVWEGGLGLWPDRWFVATLLDAYCGFLTFFVWVAYKERNLASRVLWFVLIMGLGNIAMSTYVLIRLFRLPKDALLSRLLLRE